MFLILVTISSCEWTARLPLVRGPITAPLAPAAKLGASCDSCESWSSLATICGAIAPNFRLRPTCDVFFGILETVETGLELAEEPFSTRIMSFLEIGK